MNEVPRRARSSGLPTHGDCGRRWAAEVPGLVPEEYGLPDPLLPHVGSIVGTAAHSGSAHLLNGLAATGSLTEPLRTVEDLITTKVLRLARRGLRDDSWTPGIDGAIWAARSIVRSYAVSIDPRLEPLLVPESRLAMIRHGLLVTAHLDRYLTDRRPWDLKTGRNPPLAGAQYGSYSMQLRANGYEPLPVFDEFWMPRPRFPGGRMPSLTRVEPKIRTFDAAAVELVADGQIKAVMRDLDAWERTGDPDSFQANPQSRLCSQKFCRAWGSKWCHAWRLKPPQPEDKT